MEKKNSYLNVAKEVNDALNKITEEENKKNIEYTQKIINILARQFKYLNNYAAVIDETEMFHEEYMTKLFDNGYVEKSQIGNKIRLEKIKEFESLPKNVQEKIKEKMSNL